MTCFLCGSTKVWIVYSEDGFEVAYCREHDPNREVTQYGGRTVTPPGKFKEPS